MKSFLFATAAVAAIAVATPASAGGNGPPIILPGLDRGGDASAEASATGIGVGIGAAESNASVRNRSTNVNTNVGVNALDADLSNRNTNVVASDQKQLQGQLQAQGLNSAIGATGSGNSTSTSVTVEGSNYEAPAIAPDLGGLVGTSCMGSSQGTFGNGAVSIGLGSSWTDDQCNYRENIKLVYMLDPQAARQMLPLLDGYPASQDAPKVVSVSRAEPDARTPGMTWTDDRCQQYRPASQGGVFASAPAGWSENCS